MHNHFPHRTAYYNRQGCHHRHRDDLNVIVSVITTNIIGLWGGGSKKIVGENVNGAELEAVLNPLRGKESSIIFRNSKAVFSINSEVMVLKIIYAFY